MLVFGCMLLMTTSLVMQRQALMMTAPQGFAAMRAFFALGVLITLASVFMLMPVLTPMIRGFFTSLSAS